MEGTGVKVSRFFNIDNILGVTLAHETIVNFSNGSKTIINIPMHEGLLSTLETAFYKRQLIELNPTNKENIAFKLNNAFTVNKIHLSNGNCLIEVYNVDMEVRINAN